MTLETLEGGFHRLHERVKKKVKLTFKKII